MVNFSVEKRMLLFLGFAFAILLMFYPDVAFAGVRQEIPEFWDTFSWIMVIYRHELMYVFCVLVFITCAYTMVFQGDISQFTQKLLAVFLILATAVFSEKIVTEIFGVGSAIIL